MALRLAFDAAVLVLAIFMLRRLTPLLKPESAKFGVILIAPVIVGQTLVWRWTMDADDPPEVGLAAMVLAFSVVSRFNWIAFVPAEYRTDDQDGRLVGSWPAALLVCALGVGGYYLVTWTM